ncbi:MAG: SDR family NAD(P)-dependent oxidoreductase [Clostridiales bacterium]|nr:SDR family NAD(P)-dependent oxidoreductase [Clostridiales bacterium]
MKTVLITGFATGIGKETARLFAKNGYNVIGVYNNSFEEAKALKDELEGFGSFCQIVKADLEKTEEILSIKDKVIGFKSIDVLVNNAGVSYVNLITETDEKTWDKVFNINLKSIYLLTNLVLENMIERKGGVIVNVSSIWGITGASMEVCYSASKAGLIGYTKALSKEVLPSNIRVNCVAPGVIDTKMNDCFDKDELIKELPLGRLGTGEEVANAIYFLATNEYIVGQVLTIDGGFLGE